MDTKTETAPPVGSSAGLRLKPRFIRAEKPSNPERSRETLWWYDTWRPLTIDEQLATDPPGQRYVLVETYADKDPNNYRHIGFPMWLLFTDQAEYYCVCSDCRSVYGEMQWSGSTRSPGWREESEDYRTSHEQTKGWCEFCDPIFGNGGWSLR